MRTYVLDARTVTPRFPGIGRYVRSLAAELPNLLAADEQLTILRPPAGETAFPENPAGSTAALVSDLSPFGLRQQVAVPRMLRTADVYHSPYYLMPYRPGAPTVLTVYDLIPIRHPETVSLRVRLLFGLTTRLALSAAQEVICISHATRRDLLDQFPRLNPGIVHAVPLAPASQFTLQTKSETGRIRKKYKLPESFVLYLGSNKPHKNLVRLVQAWSRLDIEPALVISGSWDETYPEAREEAARLGLVENGRVRFVGPVPEADLPALYAAGKLFVFPSLYEGFGLPVIEAMACGTPVACSNTSSLPEVAGEAAVLFDPGSVDSIAEGLRRAIEHPSEQEIHLAQAKKFNWADTAAATLEIYRAMAYNSRHSPG